MVYNTVYKSIRREKLLNLKKKKKLKLTTRDFLNYRLLFLTWDPERHGLATVYLWSTLLLCISPQSLEM